MDGKTRKRGSSRGLRAWARRGTPATVSCLLVCAAAACESAPEATPAGGSPQTLPVLEAGYREGPPTVPAWLSMTPNYRREESERLASAAIARCNEQLKLPAISARLDSLRSVHGVAPQDTRSHPETARALDELLERQRERPACLESSEAWRLSVAIGEEAPTSFEIPVHAAPDSASRLVGTILVDVDASQPGPERITFAYRPRDATTVSSWTLDRTQVDGYGVYAHTVLERRGEWLLLPEDPFPVPVWINWSGTFRSPPEIEPVFGAVYLMREAEARAAGLHPLADEEAPGVVYERADGRSVRFRLEGLDDGPCPELRSADEVPTLPTAAGSEWSLPIEALLDDRRHLSIDVAYGRGC